MKKEYTQLYAFEDIDSGLIYPPDTCPLFSSLWEAREEKKKYKIYYSNTRIVKVNIVPVKKK